MSAYIDSMTSTEEALRLEAHLAQCAICQRELQSLSSLRNVLAQVEPMPIPEDLALSTRVKLSQARNRSRWDWVNAQLNNVLKPLAMPAFLGVSVTMLCFGILFGSLVSNSSMLLAHELHTTARPAYAAALAVDGNPQWNNPEAATLASHSEGLAEPLSVKIHLSSHGRATDYTIISGKPSLAADQWIKDFLCLAQFSPATSYGVPVDSTIILAFLDVRG
jgi:anti-sigma factor RsiW